MSASVNYYVNYPYNRFILFEHKAIFIYSHPKFGNFFIEYKGNGNRNMTFFYTFTSL